MLISFIQYLSATRQDLCIHPVDRAAAVIADTAISALLALLVAIAIQIAIKEPTFFIFNIIPIVVVTDFLLSSLLQFTNAAYVGCYGPREEAQTLLEQNDGQQETNTQSKTNYACSFYNCFRNSSCCKPTDNKEDDVENQLQTYEEHNNL